MGHLRLWGFYFDHSGVKLVGEKMYYYYKKNTDCVVVDSEELELVVDAEGTKYVLSTGSRC